MSKDIACPELNSILIFLPSFVQRHDKSVIREKAIGFYFHLLLKNTDVDALSKWIALPFLYCKRHKRRTITSYMEELTVVLESHGRMTTMQTSTRL